MKNALGVGEDSVSFFYFFFFFLKTKCVFIFKKQSDKTQTINAKSFEPKLHFKTEIKRYRYASQTTMRQRVNSK